MSGSASRAEMPHHCLHVRGWLDEARHREIEDALAFGAERERIDVTAGLLIGLGRVDQAVPERAKALLTLGRQETSALGRAQIRLHGGVHPAPFLRAAVQEHGNDPAETLGEPFTELMPFRPHDDDRPKPTLSHGITPPVEPDAWTDRECCR